MSPAPALKSAVIPLEPRRIEQRLHQRYPVMLELQYKLLEGGRVKHLGHGRTLNISSGGVLFEADDFSEPNKIPKRSETIELSINWPFLLEDACPLRLVMRGRLVRCNIGRLAVQTSQHEFRTAGASFRNGQPTAARGAS